MKTLGTRMIATMLMLSCWIFVSNSAIAQRPEVSRPNNKIDIQQLLGAKIALDSRFKDEDGKDVRLGDYFKDRPVLLMPIFYACNGSCLMIRQGAFAAINAIKTKTVGKDFDIVIIGLHPKETPQLAKAKKNLWTQDLRYGKENDGIHYLTGEIDEIRKATASFGFQFEYKEEGNRVVHPSALVVATKEGVVSTYFIGVKYPQLFVLSAIERAERGEIGSLDPKPILLGCFNYNPVTGQTTVVVEQVMRVTGVLTALILAVCVIMMSIRHRREPVYAPTDLGQGEEPKTPA